MKEEKNKSKTQEVKNILEKTSGITLIALIITIIVLLILAAVSINMVLGDGGIISQAELAVQMQENSTAAEEEAMNELLTEYESILEGETEEEETAITPTEDSEPDSSTEFSTSYGTIEVIWLEGTTNTVTSTPNEPVLTSNGESMTAVTWTYDEDTEEWTEDSTASSDWYSYTSVSTREDDGTLTDNLTSRWANAKTKNGSYFVWIPRYAYRITYYESETSTEPTGYYDGWGMWNAEDGTVKYALDDGIETVTYNGNKYIVHPAFCDGTDNNYSNGEWDEDLEGFWFAKYEMYGLSSSALKSKPNTASTTGVTIGNMYKYSRGATYGYTGTSETLSSNGTDYTYTSYMHSHLVKNSEWGAVAYLTQSSYGRNGNEIDINNSTDNYTGNGGGSTSASSASGITNAYNTKTGAKASTTGNVYGIYDMSGGAREYTAGYNALGSGLTSSVYGLYMAQEAMDSSGNYTSTKYITAYTNGTSTRYGSTVYTVSKVGDAIKEVYTGSSYYSWNGDRSYYLNSEKGFMNRGGYRNEGSLSGIFTSYNYYGSNESRTRISNRTRAVNPRIRPRPQANDAHPREPRNFFKYFLKSDVVN